MSNITSAKSYLQVEGTRQRSAVSEFLAQTIGGALNYLNDQDTAMATHLTNIAANQFVNVSASTATWTPGSDIFVSCASGDLIIAGQINAHFSSWGGDLSVVSGASVSFAFGPIAIALSNSTSVRITGMSDNLRIFHFAKANIST